MNHNEQLVLNHIKGCINALPADQKEACEEMADHFERMIIAAGEPVGSLALAYVGAKAAASE